MNTALPSALFVRRFLADYARNPVNLLMLIVVPMAFVVVAAGPMADAAELFGGPGGPAVHTATAGWAAGFLAGIAMYFQTRSARAADCRLVLAGLPSTRLVAARLATGLSLAGLASLAALVALAARTGVDAPARAVAGTLMFAVIYLAIGGLVGVLVANPVNGTVLVLFVWILDVYFGPAMGGVDRVATRPLPTHFVTLWMVDLPSRHGGRIGDLGWALVWTLGAIVVSFAVLTATSRVTGRARRRARPGSRVDQLGVGIRMGLRAAGRNPVLWALLVVVPTVFVLGSVVTTPDRQEPMTVVEAGQLVTRSFSLLDIHPGTMAPVAIASLACLAGLFVVLDSRAGDRRLTLAGFGVLAVLAARITVIALAAAVSTVASLAITATVFEADQWTIYIAGNLLLAFTYGLLGVLLGPLFGRVSGVFIAFLVPFLDLGIAQSPMLRDQPPAWGRVLPGYGSYRVLLDGAVTSDFDETGAMLIGLTWLAGLILAAALLFRHCGAITRKTGTSPGMQSC